MQTLTVPSQGSYRRALDVVAGPYWKADGAKFYLGDARELPLPDQSVHLIVTSPPYNAKIRYRGYRDWLSYEEYWEQLIEPVLAECYRVLVHGGRLCINFANILRFADHNENYRRNRLLNGRRRSARVRQWGTLSEALMWPALERTGFLLREPLTWIKSEDERTLAPSTAWGSWCSPSNPVLRAVAEPIFIASKGSYDRYGTPTPIERDDFMLWTRNVWNIPQDSHASNSFVARFPRELARRLILLYSFTGDTVLDPFAGSGTTLIEAAQNDRYGIGLDISEAYAKMSYARYKSVLGA